MVCLFGTRKSKKILAEDRKGTFNECDRILEHILVDFVHNSGNEKLCRNRLWHICGFFFTNLQRNIVGRGNHMAEAKPAVLPDLCFVC